MFLLKYKFLVRVMFVDVECDMKSFLCKSAVATLPVASSEIFSAIKYYVSKALLLIRDEFVSNVVFRKLK